MLPHPFGEWFQLCPVLPIYQLSDAESWSTPCSSMAGEQALFRSLRAEDIKDAWRRCHAALSKSCIDPAPELLLREVLLEGSSLGEQAVLEWPSGRAVDVPVEAGCHHQYVAGKSPGLTNRVSPLLKLLDHIDDVSEIHD